MDDEEKKQVWKDILMDAQEDWQAAQPKFNPRDSVVPYGKSGKWYVDNSSIFDTRKYDITAIMEGVEQGGGTNVKAEPLYGWSNQPDVVTFDYNGDPKDIEKTVDFELGFDQDLPDQSSLVHVFVRDRQFDWGKANKDSAPESPEDFPDINPEVRDIKSVKNYKHVILKKANWEKFESEDPEEFNKVVREQAAQEKDRTKDSRKVLLRAPYSSHPDDAYLEKVLSFWTNPYGVHEYASWVRNKNNDSYEWGHYFKDPNKALDFFNNRGLKSNLKYTPDTVEELLNTPMNPEVKDIKSKINYKKNMIRSAGFIEDKIDSQIGVIEVARRILSSYLIKEDQNNIIRYTDMLEEYFIELKRLQSIQATIQKENSVEVRRYKDQMAEVQEKLRRYNKYHDTNEESGIRTRLENQIKSIQDKIDNVSKTPDTMEELLNKPLHPDVKDIKSKMNYKNKIIARLRKKSDMNPSAPQKKPSRKSEGVSYEDWQKRLSNVIERQFGMGFDDFPDWDSSSSYDSDATPVEAFRDWKEDQGADFDF